MPDAKHDISYMQTEDFFCSPQKNDVEARVHADILKERQNSVIDAELVRQQEDWSFLAHRVVGAEGV